MQRISLTPPARMPRFGQYVNLLTFDDFNTIVNSERVTSFITEAFFQQ